MYLLGVFSAQRGVPCRSAAQQEVNCEAASEKELPSKQEAGVYKER